MKILEGKNEEDIINSFKDDRIRLIINENNIGINAIINTHAHYDHIGGVKYFQDELNVPFYL